MTEGQHGRDTALQISMGPSGNEDGPIAMARVSVNDIVSSLETGEILKEELTNTKRSIAMRQIYISLMILGWFAVPNFVSADWSTYSQQYWVDRGLLERDSLIHRVESPAFEDHFGLSLGRDRGRSESDRDRQSDSAASGTGTRSYDTPLGPSFDMPGSVDGLSRRPEPWWGRRPEGEPMLKDLKELNRDPMRTP